MVIGKDKTTSKIPPESLSSLNKVVALMTSTLNSSSLESVKT
jgi:hypothetical protein